MTKNFVNFANIFIVRFLKMSVPSQYTFRRPKSDPHVESYTKLSVDGSPEDGGWDKKYVKYSFIILLLMFFMMCVTLFYTYKNGLPVNIKG